MTDLIGVLCLAVVLAVQIIKIRMVSAHNAAA